MWVGYPSHPELWQDHLEPARAEVSALVRALVEPGGERVRLLVSGAEAEVSARAALGDAAEIVQGRFGDIWLRDTGPIFEAPRRAHAFRFNGWGGKYRLAHDEEVADQIAAASGAELSRHDFILEGGALEHDGSGTILTTRQCLLHENRNLGWSEAIAERALASSLGARKVLWLDEGLMNDHTDGHVDNLARFLAPGVVACPLATGEDDPNGRVYRETRRALAGMSDAGGHPLRVVDVPSPGRVTADGAVVPASHMNFLIANRAIVVPIYQRDAGDAAVRELARHFPDRQVIGVGSRALLAGGGSFHCISQQEPA
jgi:agmatine deiminase